MTNKCADNKLCKNRDLCNNSRKLFGVSMCEYYEKILILDENIENKKYYARHLTKLPAKIIDMVDNDDDRAVNEINNGADLSINICAFKQDIDIIPDLVQRKKYIYKYLLKKINLSTFSISKILHLNFKTLYKWRDEIDNEKKKK